MALTTENLTEISELLTADTDGTAFMALRQKFPDLAWTRCDASDVFEEPYQSHGDYDLHLIDARDHCVQITGDPEQATGILLAKRSGMA